jgi:hypothetical protein
MEECVSAIIKMIHQLKTEEDLIRLYRYIKMLIEKD